MSVDKRLELLQNGRVSDVLLHQFGERLKKAKDLELSKLKAKFRGGDRDAVTLASGLAAYCALEDFESELLREIKRGNIAAKEMHDNPEHSGPRTGP